MSAYVRDTQVAADIATLTDVCRQQNEVLLQIVEEIRTLQRNVESLRPQDS